MRGCVGQWLPDAVTRILPCGESTGLHHTPLPRFYLTNATAALGVSPSAERAVTVAL